MYTKSFSPALASFEEAFAAPSTQRTPTDRWPSAPMAKNGTDWREIARQALRKTTLEDGLRLALAILVAKCGEALLLQDADNLNTEDTTLILDIPVLVVQSRLR